MARSQKHVDLENGQLGNSLVIRLYFLATR